MANKTRNQLKNYFQTGDKPTQSEYADLIDSFVNRLDDNFVETLPDANTTQKGIVEQATLTEVQSGTDNTRFVTPKGAKRAVETFAPVKSVNGNVGDVTLSFNQSTDRGSTREGIAKFFTNAGGSSTNKFHIKLPYKRNAGNKMYYIKASGYNYYNSDIIDIVWVGYLYSNNLIRTKSEVIRSTAITAGEYIGTDDYVYLWFKLPNTYYATFKIDSMYVGNGSLLQEGDVEILVNALDF